MNKIIAIDFDGTLHDGEHPRIGRPHDVLIKKIIEAKKAGIILILNTCRTERKLTEAIYWCRGYKIEFDCINENCIELINKYGSDCRKIAADLYIDDKSAGYTAESAIAAIDAIIRLAQQHNGVDDGGGDGDDDGRQAKTSDYLDGLPILKKKYSELEGLIKIKHPQIRMPREGGKYWRDSRLTLRRLVKIDKYQEQEIVDLLTWLFTEYEPRSNFDLAAQIASLARLRKTWSSGKTAMRHIKEEYEIQKKSAPHRRNGSMYPKAELPNKTDETLVF